MWSLDTQYTGIQGVTYDDSYSSTYLVEQIMTKSGLSHICGHQDYDVWCFTQKKETFPYNDGKIYNHKLKNNINESIYGEKFPFIGL